MSAWDSKPDLSIAMLNTGQVTFEWAMKFTHSIIRLAQTRLYYINPLRGAPWDIARNIACKDALDRGVSWLLFWDVDLLPTQDDWIEKLIGRELPIVSGLYYRRHSPTHAAMWTDRKGTEATCPSCGTTKHFESGYAPVTKFQKGELVKVDAVGAGALLIHRRVLEAVKPPWFMWTLGPVPPWLPPERGGVSEDFAACSRFRDAGFDIFVDTNVLFEHEGNFKIGADGQLAFHEI